MKYGELYKICTEKTLANKRKSEDCVLYQMHIEYNIFKLCSDINNRILQPTAYTFITTIPKPREVFACDVSGRTVQTVLELFLRPFLEELLISTTFNNRMGKGTTSAVNNVIEDVYLVSKGFSSPYCWIIKVDMKGYFPNAVQDVAYNQLLDLILRYYVGPYRDDLIYMLQVSIYSNPTEHCYRKSGLEKWSLIEPSKSLFNKPYGIGGAIGNLIWQCAMTYYINDVCHWLVDECGLHITVYMDDIVIVTDNKESTLALIPELRKRLSEIGVTLHPHKFYCQHYTKGVEFLGHHIKMDRVYTNNRCRKRMMEKIDGFNRCVSVRNIDRFVSTINSYLGQFKTVNGYTIVCQAIKRINPKWWRYLNYDKERMCLSVKSEYTFRNRVINHYNLNHYAKRRTSKKNESARK